MSEEKQGPRCELDCGDNSCMFAIDRSGMRTNGGCRCLRELPVDERRKVQRYFRAASTRIAELEAENAKLKETVCFHNAEVLTLHRKRDEDREERAALEGENAELRQADTLPAMLLAQANRRRDELREARAELAKLKEGREVLAEGWVYREGKSWVVSAVEFLPDMDEALSAIPVQVIRKGEG